MSFLAQHKLIVIVVALVVVVGAWYTLSSSGTPTAILTTDAPTGSVAVDSADQALVGSLLTLRTVSLSGDIFNDPGYRVLKDFSTTIVPEPVGRQNPFQPLTAPASSSPSASRQVQIFAPKK